MEFINQQWYLSNNDIYNELVNRVLRNQQT